jgi:Retroviral aspartyl protease
MAVDWLSMKKPVTRWNGLKWIKWATRLKLCIKCAAKDHDSTNCMVGNHSSKPAEKRMLNAIDEVQDNIDSNGMELDSEYLCSIHNRKDILMMHHCIVNGRGGSALLDTGATKNYISRHFAEKANLKFKGTVKSKSRMVKLPNGQYIKVLGECEFELGMSEWAEVVKVTVLDLDMDFDIVLGMQWKPMYDWETLDVVINAPDGAQRIVHKFGSGVREWLLEAPGLMTLEEWPAESAGKMISLRDAEKEIKVSAKAYLYFIRERERDSDKDPDGHRADPDSDLDLVPGMTSVTENGDLNGDLTDSQRVSSMNSIKRRDIDPDNGRDLDEDSNHGSASGDPKELQRSEDWREKITPGIHGRIP